MVSKIKWGNEVNGFCHLIIFFFKNSMNVFYKLPKNANIQGYIYFKIRFLAE